MPSTTPIEEYSATGYTTVLNEIRDAASSLSPDLTLGLFALLRATGMRLSLADTDVLSGHATQFLYHREQPDCVELSFVPPVDTLFRALDVAWKEVIPSGPVAAFAVLREWLAAGKMAVMRLREPLLIYGYVISGPEHRLKGIRLGEPEGDAVISLQECDAHYWRYPLDEGNVLIAVQSAPFAITRWDELVRLAARRTVRNWHERELAGCAAGLCAYEKLVEDVRDSQIEFATPERIRWMREALWKQWSARSSCARFFERAAPRFGGRERNALDKASFCYNQCLEAWHGFALHLGPTWRSSPYRFPNPLPEEFVARWHTPQQRLAASRWIEKAAEWEGKAIGELTKVLK